jgi:hypothetical protein
VDIQETLAAQGAKAGEDVTRAQSLDMAGERQVHMLEAVTDTFIAVTNLAIKRLADAQARLHQALRKA